MPAKSSTKAAPTVTVTKETGKVTTTKALPKAKSTPKTKAASPVVKGAVVKTAAKKAAPAKAKTAKATPVVPDLPVGSIVTDAAGWWATIEKVNAKSYVLDYGTSKDTVSKVGVVLLDSIVPVPTAKVTKKGDEFSVTVTWTERHLDRPSTGGFLLGNKSVADRLVTAIKAGAVYSDITVKEDVDGKTYVEAKSAVMAKRANADLKRLGY